MPRCSDPKTPKTLGVRATRGGGGGFFFHQPLLVQMENRLKREDSLGGACCTGAPEAARKRRFDKIRIHDPLTRTQSLSTCDIFHAIPGSPSLRRFWRRRLDMHLSLGDRLLGVLHGRTSEMQAQQGWPGLSTSVSLEIPNPQRGTKVHLKKKIYSDGQQEPDPFQDI